MTLENHRRACIWAQRAALRDAAKWWRTMGGLFMAQAGMTLMLGLAWPAVLWLAAGCTVMTGMCVWRVKLVLERLEAIT
jgi:hypothetical protein